MARDSLVAESALDLADIQGFVLRAYAMPMVRHFLLTVGAPAHARRQLARLVSGHESDVPQVTTAEDWHVGFAPGPGDDLVDAARRTPDYCLNVGITWPGLVAVHEMSELSARLCRNTHRQQEVPHHRHRVSAENETLDVREVECRLGDQRIPRHQGVVDCDSRSVSRARMSRTPRPG
jgi:hypothetical protein